MSVLRIANCSGFYGDRLAAAREMVEGGPIDVLTGDYLAELTMLILWKARQRDPDAGYAVSFLAQMRDVLGTCLERGVKVVVNAGGLNPAGLARALREAAARAGLAPHVAHLEGDDLMDRLGGPGAPPLTHAATGASLADSGITPLTANAYLGSWGITEALRAGADVVVCGRVTDAALTVGPAAWAFDWALDDWDRLAGAVAAGHILECGAQATGGNYAFFTELEHPVHPGFPLAELHPDGTCVITKHPGTAGAVTTDTVTAQLLYEIGSPRYLGPDVVTDLRHARVTPDGPDRVRVAGVTGGPAPDTLKVCVNHLGGYRNSAVLVLTGLDLAAKERFALDAVRDAVGDRFATFHTRTDPCEGGARLTVTVMDPDERKVGRAFFAGLAETALSGYPGLHLEHASPRATAYGVYWPGLVPAAAVRPRVVLGDGTRLDVPEPPRERHDGRGVADASLPSPDDRLDPARTVRVPLGRLVGARSGDKGGDANVGVWARDDLVHGWLPAFLTADRLRALLPETAGLRIERHALPHLRALNFVVHGLLGDGVASSLSADPQAKALGERLRAREVDVPTGLWEHVVSGASQSAPALFGARCRAPVPTMGTDRAARGQTTTDP